MANSTALSLNVGSSRTISINLILDTMDVSQLGKDIRALCYLSYWLEFDVSVVYILQLLDRDHYERLSFSPLLLFLLTVTALLRLFHCLQS